MSDDLISRKSLIENLNKSAPEHYTALVNDLIMKEPTAFDKEMVIKELEYDKGMSAKYSTGLREQGHVEAFDEAIYVVKKGGIHNLLP